MDNNNNFICKSESINKALWQTIRKETDVNKNIKESFKTVFNNRDISNNHEIFNTYFAEVTKK